MEIKRTHAWKTLTIALAVVALPFAYQACGRFEAAKSDLASVGPLADELTLKACGDQINPGHAMIHRLSNDEYNNTVRDLLFVTSTPGDGFPSSSVGASGFSNESSPLQVTNQLVNDYAFAAEDLANEVLASKGMPSGPFARLFPCAAQGQTDANCARDSIRKLAARAYRRPVTEGHPAADVEMLMKVFSGASSFDEGLHDVIVAVLIDPRFLFNHYEHPRPDDPKAAYSLSAYELASRLSYFLWRSMPDDALFELAKSDALSDPKVLEAQAARMLKDPRAKILATVLRREWARLAPLDSGYVDGLDAQTVADIRLETQYFFEDMIANDRSLLSVLNSDTTYVNANLAHYYGWNVPQASGDRFVKTVIPGRQRRGLLTQASMMIQHGGGSTYTHPVQRGRWVTDSLFCEPPPPPPVGVPTIDTNVGSGTMRERLKAHTSNPSCIGCHRIMDTVGLGLENFDMLGKWRSNYNDANQSPIDASGQLPNGIGFNGPDGMLEGLAQEPKVKACLARNLMALALARTAGGTDDRCVANVIGQASINGDSKLSELVARIVTTPQFRMTMGGATQ